MLRRKDSSADEPISYVPTNVPIQHELFDLDSLVTTAVEDSPPKPRRDRTIRKLPMDIALARLIALGSRTATLGVPSKMPGFSLTLPAEACRLGRRLAENPLSICSQCFGVGAWYRVDYVIAAHRRHLQRIIHPRWVDAMETLILYHYDFDAADCFRWHDVGDVQNVQHLMKIAEVCRRTPEVRHWLPTHEPYIVLGYLNFVRAKRIPPIPSNLCIRISANLIGEPPEHIPGLERFPTSTTHLGRGHWRAIRVPGQSKPFECPSYQNSKSGKINSVGECGACRACWQPKVRNVSYSIHQFREPEKEQFRLPLI